MSSIEYVSLKDIVQLRMLFCCHLVKSHQPLYSDWVLRFSDWVLRYSDWVLRYRDWVLRYSDWVLRYRDWVLRYSDWVLRQGLITFGLQLPVQLILYSGSAQTRIDYLWVKTPCSTDLAHRESSSLILKFVICE